VADKKSEREKEREKCGSLYEMNVYWEEIKVCSWLLACGNEVTLISDNRLSISFSSLSQEIAPE